MINWKEILQNRTRITIHTAHGSSWFIQLIWIFLIPSWTSMNMNMGSHEYDMNMNLNVMNFCEYELWKSWIWIWISIPWIWHEYEYHVHEYEYRAHEYEWQMWAFIWIWAVWTILLLGNLCSPRPPTRPYTNKNRDILPYPPHPAELVKSLVILSCDFSD